VAAGNRSDVARPGITGLWPAILADTGATVLLAVPKVAAA
jgi:hypothetical protein